MPIITSYAPVSSNAKNMLLAVDAEKLLASKIPTPQEFLGKDIAVVADKVTFSKEAFEAADQYEQAASKGITLDTIKKGCIENILIGEGRSQYPEISHSLGNWGSPYTDSGLQTTTRSETVIGVYSGACMDEGVYTPYVQITQKSGMQIQLVLTENMRINEADNGDVTVLYGDSHKKITYSPDGSMVEVIDTEDSIDGTAGDDIIINLNGSLVDGKEGDDSIFNLADNVTIFGGSGNDSIFVPGKITNATIDTGDGNDSVAGVDIGNSAINLGAGDNEVAIRSMHKTQLKAGDGNNGIYIDSIATNSSVEIGDGNSNIYIRSISNDNSWIPNFETGSNVSIGNGNNVIHVDNISFSTLNIGSGTNEVHLTSSHGGTMKMGINSYRVNAIPSTQNIDAKSTYGINNNFSENVERINALRLNKKA